MARKGENIFKRKDGRWEGRYIKGRENGKTLYGYVFGKSYSEAKKKKAEAIAGLLPTKKQRTLRASPTSSEQHLMRDIAYQWLDELKTVRRRSTVAKYEGQLRNHILPEFGDKYINEINNNDLISFSQKLFRKPGRGNKLLSTRTVADIIAKMLYRLGISEASCVMFQNEWNRRFFIENGLIRTPNPNVQTLSGSGVNLERFSYQPYPKIEAPIIFSIIGRIMKDKGTDELLAAARIVKEKFPDVCFRMIGYFDGDYKSIVEKAIEKGIIEYIEEQEDIRPYIKDSWAVIQPSHHEGMSNVLLESAATGRPVIATDIPGCREAFDNGISGLAFPIGDSSVSGSLCI